MVWGARTTATDLNWVYVNVRRLFLFLEESIQEGIAVRRVRAEHTGLWRAAQAVVSAFLTQQWRDGALFGNTPEDAF